MSDTASATVKTEPSIKEEPSAKRIRIDFDKEITLMIGADKLTAHKSVLCAHSDFFAEVLTKEHFPGGFNLDGTDTETMQSYLHWAYRHEIIHGFDETKANYAGICNHLIKLYVVADKFKSTKLKNQALDQLRAAMDQYQEPLSPADNAFAFKSAPKSQLIDYIIDWWVYRAHYTHVTAAHLENLPTFALTDILRGCMLQNKANDRTGHDSHDFVPLRKLPESMKDPCLYHEHSAMVPRCSKLPPSNLVPGPSQRDQSTHNSVSTPLAPSAFSTTRANTPFGGFGGGPGGLGFGGFRNSNSFGNAPPSS